MESATETQSTPKIPTREDVEKLKLDWMSDPCWDLGDTQDGFEHYKDELWEFQREQEAKWEAKRNKDKIEKATKLGCSPNTLGYIEGLEYDIKKLQDRLDALEGR